MKVYYLSTCDTCRKILKATNACAGCELQDIKKQHITPDELDALAEKTGSYETLFSRKSKKYKDLGLKDKTLTEKDYRTYIISDYTFLKRPVIIAGDKIFIGSDKKTVEDAVNYFKL